LLLLVLAVAALGLPIPYRHGWWLAAVAGVFLALGRHNPLWEPLRQWIPLLGLARYPEKFLVLTAAVVPLSGALGWDHLRRRATAGDRQPAGLALAAAIPPLAASVALLGYLRARPEGAAAFVAAHSGLPPTPAAVAKVLSYLDREAALTAALAT